MDIEIGAGTGTSNDLPLNAYYDYSWSNFIIDSDLIGMEIEINQIKVNVSNSPINYESLNQQIYFKHTNDTESTVDYTNPATSGFTLVYDGPITWNGSGWQGVMLDTPFAYNASDNLQIIWENNDASWASGYPTFYTTNVETNIGAYNYQDGNFPAETGNLVTYFPNLKLGFAAENEPTVATLVAPEMSAVNVATTTTLEWSFGDNTSAVDVYFSNVADDVANMNESAMLVDEENVTSYEATDLERLTTYFWRVVSHNTANGLVVNSPIGKFTTEFGGGIVALPLGDATTSTYKFPWNFYYKNSLAETIYLAEELNFGGKLQGLSFYNTFATDLPAMPVNIWVGETTQTDLSTYIPASQLTLVFTGNVDFPAGENSINIMFDTPYNYTGGNLVLLTERELDEEYYSASDKFFNTETELANRTLAWKSDSVDINPETVETSTLTASVSSSMPNVTFYFNTEGMGSVTGSVTDGTNALADVNITIAGTYYHTTTQADGSFNFPYITEGDNYTLTASLLDYYLETRTFSVIENEESQITLTLEIIPTITVSGQIISTLTNSGIPATVTLLGTKDYSVIANSAGEYTINRVYSNNNYTIQVDYLGYDGYTAPFPVEESDIEFNLNLGQLTSPSNLTAQVSESAISLTWDAIDNHDRAWLGYNLYRDEVLLNNHPIINAEYIDSTMVFGETYQYYVTSILDEGESQAANILEVRAITYEGAGTQEEPYLITNLNDLRILSENSTLWQSNYYYQQTANIDASETVSWNENRGFTPIGSLSNKFQASYNGAGYLISDLYINRPNSNFIGLFGYTNGAKLSNITLVDNDISGQLYVGGLVAYASSSSTISNSCATGSVNGTLNYVGGLVAYASASTISNSFSSGTVSGATNIGGLVGYANNSSTISNCYASGDVSGDDSVGGLAGYSDSQTNNCYANGNISGLANNVGGLIGSSPAGETINSFWDIDSSNQITSAGGLGLTTTEMQNLSTYTGAGWDFLAETNNGSEDIWVYYDNNYPRLSWDRFLTPDFTVSQTISPLGTELEFTNTSVGQVDEFFWEFGDDSTSTEANPIYAYAASATYSVTLTVSNDKNNETLTKTDFITVTPAPDISLNPLEFNLDLTTGASSSQYLTINNNGDELLEASLSIGSTRMRSGIPELIYGPATNNQAIDPSISLSKIISPRSKKIISTSRRSYSVLYVNTLNGSSSLLTSSLSNLSNVSQFDESNASEGTTTLAYMQGYDVVIVASNGAFSSPTSLGDNLASYSDAGGKLILLNATMCSGGDWALAGAITSSEYMPLGIANYESSSISGTNFISHPITTNISTISTDIYAKTQVQGDGISLGSYSDGYPVAAYNPNKAIVAINVFPKDDKWDGDLVQLISNSIDWFSDPNDWLTLSEHTLSIASGASQTIELGFTAEDLEAGNYTKSINISSNDPDEALINIPVTMNVLPVLEANFSADKTEILSGETIQFTDLTIEAPNHWKWYLDNDEEVDSYLQNPSFTYPTNGTYSVSLVASLLDANNLVVVSDSIFFSDYITVTGTAMPAGDYSGTWSLASSPYNIYGPISIAVGSSLTIEAGSVINFMADTDFTIAGQLLADGVSFTSPGTNSREEGVWQGITFSSSPNNSSLTNSLIENASKGIEIIDASPTLKSLELNGLNREYPAIKISGSSNAVLEDLDIDNFDNGVEIYGEDSDHAPVITNIRIRHTTNTRISSGVGINLIGPANVQMTNSLIEGFASGLKISATNSSNISRNAFINNNTAVELTGADCTPQIHHNHFENQLEESATAFTFTDIGNIQILNNNILAFDYIVTGSNSSPYFSQNIIWGASLLANQLSNGTGLNSIFEYNDISMTTGFAPGTGNINVDPLFVDEDSYDLDLTIYSECIDAGNPSLTHDPDGSIADLGMNYIHHLADFESPNRFADYGTIVSFENLSQGHDAPSSILWDFGDGNSSSDLSPYHFYENPGIYDVTLTMTSGSYTDVRIRENFIIVQGEALSAPQNPSITVSNAGIDLAWEQVTESLSGTPANDVLYFIFSCDQPAGNYEYRDYVDNLSWRDEDLSSDADKQFCFVIAYLASTRTNLEEFINSHRYMTRDGKVIQKADLKLKK
jgi:PKD repeat protein